MANKSPKPRGWFWVGTALAPVLYVLFCGPTYWALRKGYITQ
jgi:hypothetical protein